MNMKTNVDSDTFDVIEVTNEMPLNRIGGVGSVIESLITGFNSVGLNALWFLVDHSYRSVEIEQILEAYPSVVVGSYQDLVKFKSPIVHIHSYNYNPQLLEYSKDKRTIFTIHSLLAYEETSNDVRLPQAVRWQEMMIESCESIVLISESEHKYYRKLGYQYLNPNVRIIHNGVKKPIQYCNQRHNRILGFCGRLVPRKHPEYVQMILKEQGFEDYHAFIAGKAFSTYARDLVCKLKIEDRVRYLGWCGGPRLEAFYDSIDVLVVPSIYEPFGMSALEAAARGIPVVCTRVGGLVEIFKEHAIYSDGETYEDFRKAMYRWLNCDKNLLISFTDIVRDRYELCFTDQSMALKYKQLFYDLI